MCGNHIFRNPLFDRGIIFKSCINTNFLANWITIEISCPKDFFISIDVLSVKRVLRCQISIDQAGAPYEEDKMNLSYWLFKIGNPMVVNESITVQNRPRFNFKFVKKSDLLRMKSWDEISDTYRGVMKEE